MTYVMKRVSFGDYLFAFGNTADNDPKWNFTSSLEHAVKFCNFNQFLVAFGENSKKHFNGLFAWEYDLVKVEQVNNPIWREVK